MVHLESDYNNGVHPKVLEHLGVTNSQRTASYGDDHFSQHARQLIREACQAPEAEIYFLAGGTQTNATMIDALLQPYEGVICCDTAHINVHEAGAVEFTGHKVLALPGHDGRLSADDVAAYLEAYYADETAEHMVRPGMVYITFPTELGTLYSLQELQDLSHLCEHYGLPLYVDGARLAYGLAASPDVDLPTLAHLATVFYIGGTKCGALCGEAVVFPTGKVPAHMLSRIKQHGALLAKSRVVGAQFEALFSTLNSQPSTLNSQLSTLNSQPSTLNSQPSTLNSQPSTLNPQPSPLNSLYLQIGREAVDLALRLRHLFTHRLGYRPYIDSPTNQQFFIIPNADLPFLRRHIGFEPWCPVDADHTACRFVTSWATIPDELQTLEELFNAS